MTDPRNKLNDLSGKEWIQETKSYFFQKGLGSSSKEAQFEKLHPAPFSYTDVGKLINFFTKKGNKVLDPFLGTGSTIKACVKLEREGYGVELIEKWCKIAKDRLLSECSFKIDNKHLKNGDSRNLHKYFEKDFFDFIVTSPPYWNILTKIDHKARERKVNGYDTSYSKQKKDIGNIEDYDIFL